LHHRLKLRDGVKKRLPVKNFYIVLSTYAILRSIKYAKIRRNSILVKGFLLMVRSSFTYTYTYSTIAREHLSSIEQLINDYTQAWDKLQKATSEEDKLEKAVEVMTLGLDIEKKSLIVITFSAMAIEAYIYDYALEHFSANFTEKFLDKLDTVSKWVIIPQLVTGKEFPRDGQAFQLLKELVVERNKIIHHKSVVFPEDTLMQQERMLEIRDKRSELPDKARKAIKTLDILADEIHKLDNNTLSSLLLHYPLPVKKQTDS
jgi:hypothetical protein